MNKTPEQQNAENEAVENLMIAMGIITAPIWGPIMLMGFIFIFPLALLFIAIEDHKQQLAINEENKRNGRNPA